MTLPAFETPRLTLRSIIAHDAEDLHEACSVVMYSLLPTEWMTRA